MIRLLPILIIVFASCMTSQEWARSRTIGNVPCPSHKIGIDHVNAGLTQATWTATCKGRKYYCNYLNTGGGGSFGKYDIMCKGEDR